MRAPSRAVPLLCGSSRDQHVHLALVLPRVAPPHLAGCSPHLLEGMDPQHPGLVALLTIHLLRGHFYRAQVHPSTRRPKRLPRFLLQLRKHLCALALPLLEARTADFLLVGSGTVDSSFLARCASPPTFTSCA
eukprot:CAMPEP_0171603644 /NCGR_PEP_ID=MMETSP0990-20121206/6139_1 /TAXON_ID=483369 /ORGANISM="non described non described, Strain CCMP2098" /LENGTH=132 /DNA_ID=CAMNT_0012166027 /DNA_START=436 /DNA_END=831 /DNA_ORIENTATION=-